MTISKPMRELRNQAAIAAFMAGLGVSPQLPDAKPERQPNPARIAAAQAKRERKAAIRKRGAL